MSWCAENSKSVDGEDAASDKTYISATNTKVRTPHRCHMPNVWYSWELASALLPADDDFVGCKKMEQDADPEADESDSVGGWACVLQQAQKEGD